MTMKDKCETCNSVGKETCPLRDVMDKENSHECGCDKDKAN